MLVNFFNHGRLTEDMDMKKHISYFSGNILKISSCYFCSSLTGNFWCNACEKDFLRQTARCPQCAKENINSTLCGRCLNNPPPFSKTIVLFGYKYPAKKLIHAFKFKKHAELSSLFANKLVERIELQDKLPDCLIPVPLHSRRQAERGYNQSLELAKHLGKSLKIEVNTSICKRIINTDPQSKLPIKSRKKNVKNAFSLDKDNVPNHIAIIDDVVTTGSTINEIAQLFNKAGCEQIDIWAIART